jgi:hypothetical protein
MKHLFKKKLRECVHWHWCWGGAAGEAVHYMRPEEGPTRRHVITHIHASLKNGGRQLLTVLDEASLIGRFYVHGQRDIPCHFESQPGKALTVYLHMTDDPDNVGALTVSGYSENVIAE